MPQLPQNYEQIFGASWMRSLSRKHKIIMEKYICVCMQILVCHNIVNIFCVSSQVFINNWLVHWSVFPWKIFCWWNKFNKQNLHYYTLLYSGKFRGGKPPLITVTTWTHYIWWSNHNSRGKMSYFSLWYFE